MKSKIFLSVIYIGVIWLVGIFIFGKSGVIDNMYQAKETIRLTEILWQSKNELESMTREIHHLSSMQEPTQAFLIEQGRKTKEIIVFKMNTISNSSEQETSSILKEQLLFFQSISIALIIIVLGCFGIYIIAYVNKTKIIKELNIESKEGKKI
ncbi:MAG: hypothetical protein KFW21_06545 [Spirochaetota bacterium]|nr:hypothetical protein [Spirochaetota bacterium]